MCCIYQFRLFTSCSLRLIFLCLGEDASLPLSSGGSYQILVNNVFYFTQRLVDKLWQGMFNKDSKLVVDFIVQLIGQVWTSAAGWDGGRVCRATCSKALHISPVLQNSLLRCRLLSSFFFEPAASRWPPRAASTRLRNKIAPPPPRGKSPSPSQCSRGTLRIESDEEHWSDWLA